MAVVLKNAEQDHGQGVCITEVYKDLCQTSKMELFMNTKLLGKIFNDAHWENLIQEFVKIKPWPILIFSTCL